MSFPDPTSDEVRSALYYAVLKEFTSLGYHDHMLDGFLEWLLWPVGSKARQTGEYRNAEPDAQGKKLLADIAHLLKSYYKNVFLKGR